MTRLAVPSKELALRIVGPIDSFFATRIQRINLANDIPTTVVDEHGNSQHVGTVLDIPNITLTFSAFDVGIKVFSVLTGTDPDSYPGAGVDIVSLDEIDAILYVKDEVVADYVKSCHGRKLQVRDFSFSYSVTGESTEDYTAIGSEKRWFKNDVIVDKETTGATSFTLSETPIQLKNGDYVLSVVLDGIYLTEVASGPATGEYSVSGTTLTTGDSRTSQILMVYHASPAGTNWTDVGDSTIPVAVRGKDVKIEIATNSISRVQSVTINGNLNPQPVREMGNRTVVGYQRQVPIVDGTITVLDVDTELIRLLVTGETDPSDTEFSIEDVCVVSGLSLEVTIYDPCDTTVSGTILKTVYIPTLRITGDAYTSTVNDNASQTYNFMSEDAQCIVYSGSR
ncbi:hypothetical protein LCGC14_1288800 [marine sediment metagenome]|uniref:Uncharacterized protein n=1 Tax=marine sediment metagenome TaxID=412755 RepID=A0A0F9NW13_9ZZZZ